jgi:hypothetical protein
MSFGVLAVGKKWKSCPENNATYQISSAIFSSNSKSKPACNLVPVTHVFAPYSNIQIILSPRIRVHMYCSNSVEKKLLVCMGF